MKLAATIIGKATDEIIAKGRKVAGILLEAAEADLDFAAATGSRAPSAVG
jgi:hypothetical protein